MRPVSSIARARASIGFAVAMFCTEAAAARRSEYWYCTQATIARAMAMSIPQVTAPVIMRWILAAYLRLDVRKRSCNAVGCGFSSALPMNRRSASAKSRLRRSRL